MIKKPLYIFLPHDAPFCCAYQTSVSQPLLRNIVHLFVSCPSGVHHSGAQRRISKSNRARFFLLLLFSFSVSFFCVYADDAERDSLLRRIRWHESSSVKDTLFVRLLNSLAYHYDGYKTDSAMILAEKARVSAEQLGDQHGLARAYINIGNIHETKGQYDSAIRAHTRGIALAQVLRDSALLARAYNGMGIVYWDIGKYEDALQSYLQSLVVYERLRDTVNTARATNNIAILHHQTNHFPEAMRYYRMSLDIARRAEDKKSILVALGNIGQLHFAEQRFDSSMRYLQESYAIAVKIGDRHSIAARLNDIGELLQAQGKYTEALPKLMNALALQEASGESTYIINSLRTIARTLAASGHAREGLSYARRAVDSAEKMGAKAYLRDALAVLTDVYDSLGRYKEALRTHQALAVLRDSLANSEAQQQILHLQAEYESEKKDKHILALTKEQELQTFTRRMLLVVGIVLLIGFAALYSRYRLKALSERALREHNTEILRQQQLLEAQATDIEMANTALNEKNLALERQQNILEEQAREIEIANAALQEKNLQLEQMNAEKNEFLGIAAHDLKNPLTHIIMSAGTATRYYDRMTDSDIQQQLHTICAVAQNMTEIISNLLDINAIEQGGLRLLPTTLDLIPTISEIIHTYTPRADEKNITLHCIIPESITVRADKQALTQVLDNLISNAVKYSPYGKNVVVRVQSTSSVVRVEVKDEGQGISQEDMKKLFGKFARLSARPTGGEHSTGLGLSIVKKLVESMCGTVWCESEEGNGAAFIVELPRAAIE